MQKKFLKLCTFVLAFVLCLSFCVPAGAVTFNLDEYERNNLVVEELTSGNIITENKADIKAYPASITKLLTALVALDYFSPTDKITVGSEVSSIPSDSSRAWISPGDTLTFSDLLHAMLLPSGNDAAVAIAVATGRKAKNDPSLSAGAAEKYFVELMNQKAKELGMTNSNFTNPHGYDDKNNYSTANDLLILGKAAINNEIITSICQKSVYSCKSEYHTYKWYSTNRFLFKSFDSELLARAFHTDIGENAYYNPNVIGLKTGNTDLQGRCFMFHYVENDVNILGVILNNGDETLWKKTDKMIRFFSQNYLHQVVLLSSSKDLKVKIPNVDYKNKTRITLTLDSDVVAYVHRDDVSNLSFILEPNSEYFELRDDTKPNYYLKKDLPAGVPVATVKVTCQERIVYERELTYENDLKVATFVDYLIRYSPLIIIGLIVVVVLILAIRLHFKERRRRLRRKKRRRRSSGALRSSQKSSGKMTIDERKKFKKPRI